MDDLQVSLGSCCACDDPGPARNIVMLPIRAPVPGTGHGCIVCHTPSDGAVALLCDGCLAQRFAGKAVPIQRIVSGYATEAQRVPYPECPELFEAHTLPPEAH